MVDWFDDRVGTNIVANGKLQIAQHRPSSSSSGRPSWRYSFVADLDASVDRRRRRRLPLLVGLTLGLLAASSVAVGGSLAIFTSAPTLGGNAFTTGTVILSLNPATALLTSANMMPG